MRLHLFKVLTASVALAACGGEPTGTDGADNTSPPPSSASIDVRDFQFTPTTVTVQAGGSVVWTNLGPSEHTSSSNEDLWDSGLIAALTDDDEDDGGGGGGYGYSIAATEGTYKRQFDDVGTYEYHCSIHPGMHGTIVVAAQ